MSEFSSGFDLPSCGLDAIPGMRFGMGGSVFAWSVPRSGQVTASNLSPGTRQSKHSSEGMAANIRQRCGADRLSRSRNTNTWENGCGSIKT